MKRFDFPLQRVMDIREKLVAMEEARLEALHGELRVLDARRAALESEEARMAQSVISASTISSSDLVAADAFRQHLKDQRVAVKEQRQDTERRTSKQREVLLEARRRYELLGRLRKKAREQWTRDFDKELETIATESYLRRTHTCIDEGPRFAHE